MKRNLTTRSLVFTLAVLAASACQKSPETASTTPAPDAPAATDAQTTPQAAPKVNVCTLLSAAEVSAVMGKTLIQDGCTYGLDPAAKEKALAESQKQLAESTNRAAAGDLNGFMKGMMQAGAGQQKTASIMGDQMTVTVDASRDDQTEEAVKAIYAKTGGTVRGAIAPLAPEQRGLHGVIEGLDEVSNVGDWAFATNVASVNMGPGFSARGRILEARKGPWHVTVSATVGPDPGAAALDERLAGVARALIAKL
ncbi:MAG TPA: hypothetical protein VIA62_23855 [Thermoanaerobaculia bacterium]|jgi:hypothetical protein|nr:hypothetical protein [Thermoanaerobaculia bacterium]